MSHRFGPFTYDPTVGRLHGVDGEIHLRPKTFEVLGRLLDAAPALVDRDALVEAVWDGRVVSDTVLAQAISELRGVLQDDPREPTYIETVHRRGYRFIHSVDRDVDRNVDRNAEATDGPLDSTGRHSGPSMKKTLALTTLLVAVLLAVAAWWSRRDAPAHDPREVERVAFVVPRSGPVTAERWPDVLVALVRDRLEPWVETGGPAVRTLLPIERVLAVAAEAEHWRTREGRNRGADLLGVDHLLIGAMNGSNFEMVLWRRRDGAEVRLASVPFNPVPTEPVSSEPKGPSQEIASVITDTARQVASELAWPLVPQAADRPARTTCWRDWIQGSEAVVREDHQVALVHFTRAVDACPQSAALHLSRSRSLEALGRSDEALASARDALRASGRNRWQRMAHERFLAGDLDSAARHAIRRVEHAPDDGSARLTAARWLTQLSDPQQAEGLLRHRSLDVDPFFDAERKRLLEELTLERPTRPEE